jgi:class 3 adenylate cyclase
MAVVIDKSYCFAEFTLDLRRGCLRRGDEDIALRPKSLEVLRYFVENAGRLVGRDELLSAIWRDVIVTDESLTQCVSDIRSALGDRDQRIIKTVLRRGYSFVAPVAEPAAARRASGHMVPAIAVSPESIHTDREHLDRRHPERRQLTILFCDLVGSTALSTRLDPEDLHDLMGAYHRACAEEITKAGGFAAEHWGDAVVAYFGYPRAQEDDAERAIRAALRLTDAIGELARRRGSDLQIRVGIASGLVVVGGMLDAHDARLAGETPIIATRLQGLAAPGRIVISDSTRQLASGLFDYRDLGQVTLSGRAEPVHAWEVVAASLLRSRFEAKRGIKLTPLVGRQEEMELLMRCWRQAQRGDGRVMLIAGEAGIGKSRLTVELRDRLRIENHATVQYFCSPHHADSPFHPVAAQIEHAAGIARQDSAEAKLEKLASLLGASAREEADLPLLAELLSIPSGDRRAILGWSPQRKRKRTLDALLRQLERVSGRGPLLAILEDAHWIDPSSQELLDLMVERVPGLPVLLVITHRPEFEPPWIGAAHASVLTLSRLGRRDSEALATLVAGAQELAEEVVTAIAARSDGIPISIEELTKAVIEAGIAHADQGAAVSAPASMPAVPATLQASLIARLDRLGAPVNEIAETAAVIGREFSYELIEAVAQKSAEELEAALASLVGAGLVWCRGTPPQATYLFKHALVRDAAYERLLRSRRQSLHARIALVLEERFLEIVEQKPELLALQWTEAGVLKPAIAYWGKAAILSRQRGAPMEAIAQARKGLSLLGGIEEGPERSRTELELQGTLAWATFHGKGESAPETGPVLTRCRSLCEELGERARLGAILYVQASHQLACAQFRAGRQTAEEMLRVAIECNDFGLVTMAHEVLGRLFFCDGDFTSARAHCECALRDPPVDARDRYEYAVSGRTVALAYLALVLVRLGHLDQAAVRRDQALATGRKAHPVTLACALVFASIVNGERGEREAARECVAELSTLAREQSFPFWAANAELRRASILGLDGDTGGGLLLARRAFAHPVFATMAGHETDRLILLAQCCARAGRTAEALHLIDTALAKAAARREHYLTAEFHRLKGEWLAAHDPARYAEAIECHQRAIAIAREQLAKFFELRAATGLARLWRHEGKHAAARDLLAPVYGWFTEGLDTPDLRAAKALLDTL